MGIVTPENRSWLFGYCWMYAVALNKLTGWRIWMCSDDPDPDRGFYHAVVERPEGWLFDASGIVGTDEIQERYKRRQCFLCYPEPHHTHDLDVRLAVLAMTDGFKQLEKIGIPLSIKVQYDYEHEQACC